MDKAIEQTIDELMAAVGLLDRHRVNALSRRLIAQLHRADEPLPADAAKDLLSTLRRKRFFTPMQHVADALVQTGQDAATVRRQYAQALIDRGALVAATAVLEQLLTDAGENAEVCGLLGRAYKQRYIDALQYRRNLSRPATDRHVAAIREAVRWYSGSYEQNPATNFWHGINAVACAMRARRDGVSDGVIGDPRAIATAVRDAIDGATTPGAWQLATALEASVALDDEIEAIGWAVKYIRHPDADAFEIASTVRQLEQVWGLTSTSGIGVHLLPLLRGALLERRDGAVEVSPAEMRKAGRQRSAHETKRLEKVFGVDAFTSYDTYVKGGKRARTVARIGREMGGRGDGTGFLVRGADLSDRYKDEKWLLLTNAHVISNDPAHAPAVQPDDAVITFEALPLDSGHKVRAYAAAAVLHVSSPKELDFAVIKLDGDVADVADDDRCEVAKGLPVNNQQGRVYIIGHPAGGNLSYSLQDNLLLDYDDPLLHYRAPTEGGSSGSPIYNAAWKLIGLHHAGSTTMPRLRGQGGTYAANEGIWIQAIRRALAAS
ncbi:MAG TPA: serine protease [Gemmatimonadaceae bacterium]|nr:serine protease [Gemmatimonadaceae bacterium]